MAELLRVDLLAAVLLVLGACGQPATSADNGDGDVATTSTEDVATPWTPPVNEPIERVRTFECDEAAVGDETLIADVEGMAGASIAIRPSDEACRYHLWFTSADESEARALNDSVTPGGFLLSSAGVSPSGDVVVCASDIQHDEDPDSGMRRTQTVPLLCAVRQGESWTPMAEIVAPDDEYAAWVLGIGGADDGSSVFQVVWIRDFSFQFLNLHNEDRPAEDGVYSTVFSVVDGAVEVGQTTKASDEVFIADDTEPDAGWEPTEEEKLALSEYIDFSDGDCPPPDGCPMEPPNGSSP